MTVPGSAECWWRLLGETPGTSVAHVDLTPCARREAVAWAWLDQDERARSKRFVYAAPRRRLALCRAALRALLCDALGVSNERLAFTTTDHGKPRAQVNGRPTAVSFNVSHSGRHGLVALAPRGRVGVDVEERSACCGVDGLGETVLGPQELAELQAARGDDKLRLFLTLWTFKEALVKATGRGLSCDVSLFEIPAAMRRGKSSGTFHFPHMPNLDWRLHNLGNAAYAAAVAHEEVAGSGVQ